jgi:hypothetical protein
MSINKPKIKSLIFSVVSHDFALAARQEGEHILSCVYAVVCSGVNFLVTAQCFY